MSSVLLFNLEVSLHEIKTRKFVFDEIVGKNEQGNRNNFRDKMGQKGNTILGDYLLLIDSMYSSMWITFSVSAATMYLPPCKNIKYM